MVNEQRVIDQLTRQNQQQAAQIAKLKARLEAIADEAEEELDRIETEGGLAGFPLRVRALARRKVGHDARG